MSKVCKPVSWAGLDVAQESFDAALYLPLKAGMAARAITELPKETFPRTMDGVKTFLEWTFRIREKAGLKGGSMRVVMEATGRYSQQLAIWLKHEAPFSQPAVADPKTIHDFIKSLKIRNKTDRLDAGAIARYGYERTPEAWLNLPNDYAHLRELCRLRIAILDQATEARLRLRDSDQNFPTTIAIQERIVQQLEQAVTEIELEIKRCVEASEELRHDVAKAITVPGVALITAALILAECGPLRLYNSRSLGAYSGLAPQRRDSGTSVRGSRIGRGPAKLRRCLYMAANAAIQYNPRMKALHQRLVEKGRKPLQAHCAVMHKLLILVRGVVVSGVDYQENFIPNRVKTLDF